MSGNRYIGQAVVIPAGSLNTWRAARAAAIAGTARVEVVCVGDSTTYGQTAGTDHSWVNQLRSLALAAGWADGGRGLSGLKNETVATSGENLAGVSAQSGFAAAGGSFDLCQNYTQCSTTNGDTITFTGKGTRCRIYSTQNGFNLLTGGFTYSLDGGSAVTVTADGTLGVQITHVGPFAEGTHTLTITNNNTALGRTAVVVDWIRDAGIVFHKQGVPGVSAGYMGTTLTAAEGAPGILLATLGGVTTNNTSVIESLRAKDPSPARNVKLAIIHLGINNEQAAGSASAVQTAYQKFARVARAMGADPLMIVPHFESATHSENAATFRAAVYAAQKAENSALVDFSQSVLGPVANWITAGYLSNTNSPHLNAAGYDAQAARLWDVLGNY